MARASVFVGVRELCEAQLDADALAKHLRSTPAKGRLRSFGIAWSVNGGPHHSLVSIGIEETE